MIYSSQKVLVLGNYRETITVIRSLGNCGFDVIVGRSGEKEFTEFSRYTSETWLHPDFHSQAIFIDSVIDFISKRADICLVFPVGESVTACIAQHIHRFPSLPKVACPEKALFFTCLDKESILNIIKPLGIPLPKTKIARNIVEVYEGAKELGYPCVVKPNDSFNYFWGMKAMICRAQAELEKQLPSWPCGNDNLLVQRYVTGHRHNCHFFAVGGEIVAFFESKVLRTDRKNGTGYGVDNLTVRPTPLLQGYCSLLLGKLDYTGVGCVQFLVGDGGEAYFLEINPRLDANCALPYRYGYDFPRLSAEHATGGSYAPKYDVNYPAGKRAHWLMGDIRGLIHEAAEGKVENGSLSTCVAAMLRSFISADSHITWSWRDPMPTLYLYGRLCSLLLKKAVTRIIPMHGLG